MPNEDALTTVLITLANACKVTAQENSLLAVEVASLQHAVESLTPKFSEELFQKMKKENQSAFGRKSDDVTRMLDEIIRRLKDGEVL